MQAIILAAAGLKRLGLANRIAQIIAPEVMLPAAGQGALGIEIRQDDQPSANLVSTLMHEQTFREVSAERAVSRALGGSCQVPLAAYCVTDLATGQLVLRARIAMPDGSKSCRSEMSGADPEALGLAVSHDLMGQGAADIISALAEH
jgi:hydroxymethylbilane synthase